jgi:hypothetical protein
VPAPGTPDPREYPYELPSSSSLVLAHGEAAIAELDRTDIGSWKVLAEEGEAPVQVSALGERYAAARKARRWPVIAYGSNANPDALRRKLSKGAPPLFVPLLAATLPGFDTVYSAHVSTYGAIPATLYASPGASLSTYVLLLDEEQLELMDATEPNYRRNLLRVRDRLQLEDGPSLAEAYAYMSRWGALSVDGSPVGLQAVEVAGGEVERRMSEPEALEHVRRLLGAGESVEEFVRGVDRAVSEERTLKIKQHALPPDPPLGPGPDKLPVRRTTEGMRGGVAHNYVAAVPPDLETASQLGRYAVLTHDVTDGLFGLRRLGVLCRVSIAPELKGGGAIAADQSLRSAVGIPFPEADLAAARVSLRPISISARAARREWRVVRWFGWRYLLMRVVPADVRDMEKRFARIPDDAFTLLGSVSGDHLRIESAVPGNDGTYEVRHHRLRAFDATDRTVEIRNEKREAAIEGRYPDPETILGVEPDLHPIFLDACDREVLGVNVLDVVTVRRNLGHQIGKEVREFGIAFVISALGLNATLGSTVALAAAPVLAFVLVLVRIRARGS